MTALLHESISALEAIDPAALSDGQLHELVIELQAADARLAAVRGGLLSAWDGRRLWADDGSKAGWGRLARECRLSSRSAKREMVRARKLATMPAAALALAAGTLSVDDADLLRGANQPAIVKVFARDEQVLIGEVRKLRYNDARKAVDYWIDMAYDELGLDRPYRSRDGRYLKVVRTLDGTVDVRGRLDALAGTEVMTELHRIEQQLFEQDWADARANHGPDALPEHLPRTFGQRQADALQTMARNSAGYRDGIHRLPRPLITIHAGQGTFNRLCELADGTVIAPAQAVPYLCEGDIERIVFDSPSRVIDVGVRERFFTGALRRAIQARDRHCQHPSGCDIPAEDCDIDHIIEHAKGGLTTQRNGRCACRTHNLQRNNQPEHFDPDARPPPDDDTS
ncbi:MAG: hypothetical protein QOD92_809 [Acidimicrobiaceae bacterium]|jgi:hypothetical protein